MWKNKTALIICTISLMMGTNALNAAAITKSINDKRDYKYFTLDNGIKALVVSDPEAQRAAAAVDVKAGSADDPTEFPGLAHFLEHMLFLGTDQYPEPDDYINYISDHGGNHNAYTAFDHTNYFFDISPDYLEEGLKRFSRFFVAPLMSDKYVERERNAVHSEYQSKLREDTWRGMDALKSVVNPQHPYAKFSVGSLETLPTETVKPALLKFYETYYSADKISVVVIGKESTEQLESWVKTLFKDVPKRADKDQTINEKLFTDEQLPLELKSKTIKNQKELSLYFNLPYKESNEYSKSLAYLAYVIGYEGNGSLLSTLKDKGFATGFYAGSGYKIGEESSFEISVELTDEGYKNTNLIVAYVFAYLDLIRADETTGTRYNELAQMAKVSFKFQEKRDTIHDVSGLATKLNRFPAQDVLSIGSIFKDYDKAEIDSYLSLMTPDKMMLHLMGPDIRSETKTHYFDVETISQKLNADDFKVTELTAQIDKSRLHLPNPNPFVVEDTNDYKDNPVEIDEKYDNGLELFYRNNTDFSVPRAETYLSIQPVGKLTIAEKAALELYAEMLEEELNEVTYDASTAGLLADISSGEMSLSISLSGYQDKMPVLLEKILAKLASKDVDADIFAREKQALLEKLENEATKMPYQQTFKYLTDGLLVESSLPAEKYAALNKIQLADISAIHKKIFSDVAIRMLVYGNLTKAKAENMAGLVSQTFASAKLNYQWKPNTPVILLEPVEKRFDVNHQDHAITLYLQGGEGFKQRAMMGLVGKLLAPQFFSELRTEKQLGYIVAAFPRPYYNQSGIAFTVQSPTADDKTLQSEIKAFYENAVTQINALDEATFDSLKAILAEELLQQPENLADAAERYWNDILTSGQTASSRQAIADEVKNVTLAEFKAFYQDLVAKQRTLTIFAMPKIKNED